MYTVIDKKHLRVYKSGNNFFVYKRLKEPILKKNILYENVPKRRNKSKEIITELEYKLAG